MSDSVAPSAQGGPAREGQLPLRGDRRTQGGVASPRSKRVAEIIRSRRLAAALMVAYVLVVSFIVFWPNADVATRSVLDIWSLIHRIGAPAWISGSAIEFLTNAMMFMPLSFLGSTLKPHWGWRDWLVVGLAATLAIEITQWLLLPGRSAQLSDVASNTLGAVAGFGVVVLSRRKKALRP